MNEMEKLLEVVARLRDPDNGCPWDLKQSHESLLKYLIEESYEFINAVEDGDDHQMKDELGDILLQVLLHAQLKSEKNKFNFNDVAKNLKEKLIRRHPHVFEGKKVKSAEEVTINWEKIKKEENKDKEDSSLIKKDVLNYPSLYSAYKIGRKSNKIKFDWEDYKQVIYKVEEEWQELKEELAHDPTSNIERIKDEIGDFLFSTAQLARHLNLEPEECLRQANKKFLTRFHKMEKLIQDSGNDILKMDQQSMDEYWGQSKEILRNEKS